MSSFSEQAAGLVRKRLDRLAAGSLVILRTRQLGLNQEGAAQFARQLSDSLRSKKRLLRIDPGLQPVTLEEFSFGGDKTGLIVFATSSAKSHQDAIVVDPGFAARLRDARSLSTSDTAGHALLILLEDEIDTLSSAALDLTAQGEVLSPNEVIRALKSSCHSPRMQTFLDVAEDQLVNATRGSPTERGRLFHVLSSLVDDPKPDVGASLPKLGPWMPDTKMNSLLDVKTSSDELEKRLEDNERATDVVSAASASPGDAVRILEKHLKEETIDSWVGKSREQVDFEDWRKSAPEKKRSTSKWSRFRYASGDIVVSEKKEKRHGHFIVFESNGFKITTVYEEWPKVPPVRAIVNGRALPDDEAAKFFEVRSKEVTLLLPPRSAEWQFIELNVYTGKTTKRGAPHSTIRVALPSRDTPAFYLPAFEINGEDQCLSIVAGVDAVLTSNSRSYKRDLESDTTKEARFASADAIELPVRVLDGPAAATTWRFTLAEKPFEVPLSVERSEEETQHAPSFVSALHDLMATGTAHEWRYLQEQRVLVTAEGDSQTQTRNLSPVAQQELTLEQEIITRRYLAPRRTTGSELSESTVPGFVADHPDVKAIRAAYADLFTWLNENKRLPTLTLPDGAYKGHIERVVSTIESAILKPALPNAVRQWIWKLGAVTDEHDRIAQTTPLWPPALAYSLGLINASEFGTVPENRIRSLTPEAFVPTLIQSPTAAPNRRLTPERGGTGFWLRWRSVEDPGDTEIPSVRSVIAERLKEFTRAFPQLVGYHAHAPLLLKFIGVIPDENVVAGIEDFLDYHIRLSAQPNSDRRAVEIRAEFYLEKPSTHTDLDERMSGDVLDLGRRDLLREFLTYAKRPLSALVSGPRVGIQAYSHVAFVARGFQRSGSIEDAATLFPSVRVQGIVPSPATDLFTLASGANDVVAFGLRGLNYPAGLSQTTRFALRWNQLQAILAGEGAQSIADDMRPRVPGVKTLPQPNFDIATLYEHSVWVVHLQPGVSLIPLTRESTHRTCLVHFTDQRDPTTLGFDEVTITQRRKDFLSSLKRMCEETNVPSSTGLLEVLNSLNGRWTLDLLSKPKQQRQPKLACATAAAYVLAEARKLAPDTLWMFAGWEDFNRVTGAVGLSLKDSALPTEGGGSDDVILVGVNTSRPEKVRLLLVESKYGKQGPAAGEAQILTTVENLRATLSEATELAGQMARAELGRYIIRVAERMYVHHVLGLKDLERLCLLTPYLLEGNYDVEFDSPDELPSLGYVVNVDSAIASLTQTGDANVRRVKLPWAHIAEISTLIDPAFLPEVEEEEANASADPREKPEMRPELDVRTSVVPLSTPEESPPPALAIPAAPVDPLVTQRRAVQVARPWPQTIFEAMGNTSYVPPVVNTTTLAAVDQALHDLGVEVYEPRPSDVVVGPQATAVHLTLAPDVRLDKLERALGTLKLKLGVTGDLFISTYERAGAVTLFVPHQKRQPVPLYAFATEPDISARLLPFPAGITAENKPLWLDLAQTNHLLVAGTTGSGKTVYLQGVIAALATWRSPDELRMHLIDPKRLDFAPLAGLPHVAGDVLTTSEQALDLMRMLVTSEIPRRQEALARARARSLNAYRERGQGENIPYIVVVIDEYNELLMALDRKERDELEDFICRVAQIGRALGLYLVLSTQRPSVDVVSGRIKANFPTRISFRLPSRADSQVVLDSVGAESLLPGGDGLLVGLGPMRRFQAFFVDDATIDLLVAATNPLG